MSSGDGEGLGGTRRDMRRAIWRIGVLETVVLGLTMVAAMVGGALLAAIGNRALALPFRTSWIVCSVVLFAVPALLHTARERRSETASHGSGPEAGGRRRGDR